MKISANVQMGIGAAVAVFSAVAQGQIKLPMGIPPEAALVLISWDNFLIGIYLIASPIMLGFSSSAPGILAPQDPQVVKAATAVADLPPNASPSLIATTKATASLAVTNHQP
jgi:hypothetical protein